jgi:predicted GH43/DUF377 family glycosyl hydrolase
VSAASRQLVAHADLRFGADPSRVLARPFVPGRELGHELESRSPGVLGRILALPEEVVASTLDAVTARFAGRHRDLRAILRKHSERVAPQVDGAAMSDERRLLIGAYLTGEYAVEAAALFNPSAVAHPDQSGLAAGAVRFVLSLRAVGEGHFSTLEFRTGVVGPGHQLRIDDPGPFLDAGQHLPTTDDLELPRGTPTEEDADGDYEVEFDASSPLGERILWPHAPSESHGIEDARFLRFVDDDGSTTYFATYTAYNGQQVAPRLIETADFCHFRISRLSGPAARNKGMALFPRKVDGRYVALSRYDRETSAIATSTDGRVWGTPTTLQSPEQPWELIQLGNSGSPVETEAGWLVLTHGVGPMREYCLGAILLDLDDPSRVIAALREPLLRPAQDERDGYVPNVVYSCGALSYGDQLLLPYGVSDSSVAFAYVDVPLLLDRLAADGPSRATRSNNSA